MRKTVPSSFYKTKKLLFDVFIQRKFWKCHVEFWKTTCFWQSTWNSAIFPKFSRKIVLGFDRPFRWSFRQDLIEYSAFVKIGQTIFSKENWLVFTCWCPDQESHKLLWSRLATYHEANKSNNVQVISYGFILTPGQISRTPTRWPVTVIDRWIKSS